MFKAGAEYELKSEERELKIYFIFFLHRII